MLKKSDEKQSKKFEQKLAEPLFLKNINRSISLLLIVVLKNMKEDAFWTSNNKKFQCIVLNKYQKISDLLLKLEVRLNRTYTPNSTND